MLELPAKGPDGYAFGARRADWLLLDVVQAVGRIPFAFGWSGADFAVLSGDPFSVWTRVEPTWVEGRKVFDLSDPGDALYAEGGPGASRGQVFHMCCFQDWGNAR